MFYKQKIIFLVVYDSSIKEIKICGKIMKIYDINIIGKFIIGFFLQLRVSLKSISNLSY